jgi:hypothetical protein
MPIKNPNTPYERAYNAWSYGGGQQRGEPMPRARDFEPDPSGGRADPGPYGGMDDPDRGTGGIYGRDVRGPSGFWEGPGPWDVPDPSGEMRAPGYRDEEQRDIPYGRMIRPERGPNTGGPWQDWPVPMELPVPYGGMGRPDPSGGIPPDWSYGDEEQRRLAQLPTVMAAARAYEQRRGQNPSGGMGGRPRAGGRWNSAGRTSLSALNTPYQQTRRRSRR